MSCSQCGIDGVNGVCSMCYGDIDYGNDGIYRDWMEQQMLKKQMQKEEEKESPPWLYYIPHSWEEREMGWWEDIWVKPVGTNGKSLWLTLDSDDYCKKDGLKLEDGRIVAAREYYDKKMQDKIAEFVALDEYDGDPPNYTYQGQSGLLYDISERNEPAAWTVKLPSFTKEQVVIFARDYLIHRFGECGDLIPGKYEDFEDSNDDAIAIEEAVKMKEKWEKQNNE